jgi:NADPH:quinone reductase-like Zn-dependent oxidoreductase
LRAIQVTEFGDAGVLRTAELQRPSPISTELLVEVRAAGVNPVDWKTRKGSGVSAWVGPPPFVPGWDVAGVVAEMGFGVTAFEPGDRVFGMPWFPREAAAYAEYVTAPSRQFARMPDGLSFEEAAALPLASLTAWQSLVDTAKIEPGQRVLVNGAAGGVGHIAVQIAKAHGATVIGTGRAANHDFMRALGVDEPVNREVVALADAASEVDVVIDLVGGDEAGGVRTLRDGGMLIAVAGDPSDELKEEAAGRGVRVVEPLVEPDGHALGQIAALVEEGLLKVTLERVLPLEQAAEAHELSETGSVRGKLVLTLA